jgi:purine-nucleoside phosphorylase
LFTAWNDAVQLIRRKSGAGAPDLAVVLGSGLGGIVDSAEILSRLSYQSLDGMPGTSVHGHKGELIVGRMSGKTIWFFSGRFHLYEGYSATEVVAPVVLSGAAGCPRMLLTNAAGAINDSFKVGSFMWISDHINMMGENPLRGVRQNPFIDLCHLYKNKLFPELARRTEGKGSPLNRGVLAGVLGPSYETPAEVRALRNLGADAVSMSTIPETIMAKYLGMEVAGLSFLANAAAGLSDTVLDHAEVLKAGQTGVEQFSSLFPDLIDLWC